MIVFIHRISYFVEMVDGVKVDEKMFLMDNRTCRVGGVVVDKKIVFYDTVDDRMIYDREVVDGMVANNRFAYMCVAIDYIGIGQQVM